VDLTIRDIILLVAYLVIIVVFIMKLATKEELKDKVKERNDKINVVYKRIDDLKKDCSETFVRKDISEQNRLHTHDEILKLDSDAKTFRHEMLNIVQKISLNQEAIKDELRDKFSELKELILKK